MRKPTTQLIAGLLACIAPWVAYASTSPTAIMPSTERPSVAADAGRALMAFNGCPYDGRACDNDATNYNFTANGNPSYNPSMQNHYGASPRNPNNSASCFSYDNGRYYQCQGDTGN